MNLFYLWPVQQRLALRCGEQFLSSLLISAKREVQKKGRSALPGPEGALSRGGTPHLTCFSNTRSLGDPVPGTCITQQFSFITGL